MAAGFIFDMDGVLTDTVELHYQSWKRLTEEEGIAFTRAQNETLRGLPRQRSLEILLGGRACSPAEFEALMTRKNEYFRVMMEQITPADLLPGVGDFLRSAAARGMRLGLASSSRNAREVTQRLGVLHLFDALEDGYSLLNPKPAPDVFLAVAERLGLAPQRCVVFEDAAAGVEAACLGGFWVVGIGPEERVGQAHRVIPGLSGFSPADFLPPLA